MTGATSAASSLSCERTRVVGRLSVQVVDLLCNDGLVGSSVSCPASPLLFLLPNDDGSPFPRAADEDALADPWTAALADEGPAIFFRNDQPPPERGEAGLRRTGARLSAWKEVRRMLLAF